MLRIKAGYFYEFEMLCLLMKRIGTTFLILSFWGTFCLNAQISADCVDAVPIFSNTPINGAINGYGNDDFNGAESTGCLETSFSAIESNSAWYRFRTGASGLLGFNIGIDTSEDWDFALYKADDCSNLGEPVRCNFFDNNDEDRFIGVGEDPTGNTENIQYEDWLQVEIGEDYYLLLNNFSNNNSGFSIQFSGNIFVTNPYDALDSSIISNLLGPPISACSGNTIILDASASMATDYNWFIDQGAGFQLINGEHNATLQVVTSALYRVELVGTNEFSDVQVAFSQASTASAVSNDVVCSRDDYDLSLKDSEALGTQDSDEFVVSYYTSLVDADSGNNSIPKMYTSQTIGLQVIYVRVASVENPSCYAITQFELTNVETPTLNFPTQIFVCENVSSIRIGAETQDPNYEYMWSSGQTTSSIDVSEAGTYSLSATNRLGVLSCSTVKSVTVVISSPPEIADVEIQDLHSDNIVTVITDIEGDWEFQLDNGSFQSQNVFSNVLPGAHTVTVNDPAGCGSDSKEIVVVGFSKFFSPNGDGNNDLWNISGISSLENPIVHIYDRYGKLLKQLSTNSAGWDGMLNGMILPSADYWFKLTYVDNNGQTTEAKYINNHFSLKR